MNYFFFFVKKNRTVKKKSVSFYTVNLPNSHILFKQRDQSGESYSLGETSLNPAVSCGKRMENPKEKLHLELYRDLNL